MATALRPSGAFQNVLLRQFSPQQIERLSSHWEKVDLQESQVLHEPDQPIEYAYFPEAGMLSIVSEMQNGDIVEVGRIGREGVAGAAALLGADSTPFRCFVQVAGSGYGVDMAALKTEFGRSEELREAIQRHQAAFLALVMQGAACNRLHSLSQRCCRWLLLFHDSSGRDGVSLNPEFLAMMVGIKRASLSEILEPLHEQGWVESKPEGITILDRKGLESDSCACYGIIATEYERILGQA
jgi:CRP-like cAMP-binding protein